MKKIIILLLLLLISIIIYLLNNTESNKSNNLNHNYKIKKNKNQKSKNLPESIDTIFTGKDDCIHIFKNKEYWKIDRDNQINYFKDGSKIWNWPDNWKKIDHAIYNPTFKETVFIKNNNANILKDNKLESIPINTYWNNAPNNFDCVFCYDHSTYFLKDNLFYEYTDSNQPLPPKKIHTKWKNIPINCTSAFINNNHLLYGMPQGMPCFIKNNKYFSYCLHSDKPIKGTIKDGFKEINTKQKFNCLDSKFNLGPYDYMTKKYTTKQVKIKDSLQHYIIPKSGLYRFKCIGAGCGGKGGKVFNDYKLNKGDLVKLLVGQAGVRAPMANQKNDKILPKSNSCSGSGASLVYVNDHLLLVSGGGGGWSSEIYDAPYFAHSQYNNHLNKEEPSVVYIIKKIIIEASKENSKITIKNINIENDAKVIEYPKKYNKNFIYETEFSDKNSKPKIEIIFNKPQTDIALDIDFNVINKKGSRVDNNIYFYDDSDNLISVLQNLDKRNFQLNSNNIVNYHMDFNSNFLHQNNIHSKNGGSISNCKSISEFNNPTTNNPKKNNMVSFLGGFGGGGSCKTNVNSNIISCGGGGGYIGGRGIELPEFFKMSKSIPNISATGGSSFVHFSNNDMEKTFPKYFVNDYNEGNGEVEIILLLEL